MRYFVSVVSFTGLASLSVVFVVSFIAVLMLISAGFLMMYFGF